MDRREGEGREGGGDKTGFLFNFLSLCSCVNVSPPRVYFTALYAVALSMLLLFMFVSHLCISSLIFHDFI